MRTLEKRVKTCGQRLGRFRGFQPEPGVPRMKLDLHNNPDYHGNTAKQFVKADLAELILD